jgi:capsule biosynthesis phosphatase
MEKKKATLIYDLDETLCTKKQPHETYADVQPIQPMIDQLNEFYDSGYEIIISSARNMVTQKNHVSKVVQNVGLDTIQWLDKHGVKYHGLQFGKEYGAIYIDDKACLNDVNEIERRIKAIENGNEKEYLAKQKEMLNKLYQ